jgi:hypothetical protein
LHAILLCHDVFRATHFAAAQRLTVYRGGRVVLLSGGFNFSRKSEEKINKIMKNTVLRAVTRPLVRRKYYGVAQMRLWPTKTSDLRTYLRAS